MENYDNEKEALYNSIQAEEKSRNTILAIMQKFAEATDDVDIESVEKIKVFLDNLKSSLNLSNENINTLNKILNDMDNISISLKGSPSQEYENNSAYEDLYKNTQATNKEIEPSKYEENTLIISEVDKKVILPYNISDLNEKLQNSDSAYSSIESIIKKEYTLPISLFKNPFIARFRESFKLMRTKEKSSIKEAFDLGLELMFNYNLHPAIITACKNLDELDIYLDYLENGETDKFDIFKISFEIAPTVVKAKHRF